MTSWYPVIAVLKHSSPTASPSAPKPCPHTVRPSANTTTPVAPIGWGAGKGRASAMGGKSLSVSGKTVMSLRRRRYGHWWPWSTAGQPGNRSLGQNHDQGRHQGRNDRCDEKRRQGDHGNAAAGPVGYQEP